MSAAFRSPPHALAGEEQTLDFPHRKRQSHSCELPQRGALAARANCAEDAAGESLHRLSGEARTGHHGGRLQQDRSR